MYLFYHMRDAFWLIFSAFDDQYIITYSTLYNHFFQGYKGIYQGFCTMKYVFFLSFFLSRIESESNSYNNNNNNNWNLYSAFSIHKMFKSAAHCHSLSNSPQRLNGRA